MIEYILVISVTVIIVLGLSQRMYKPLGDFIEGFMGSYVACLLETGELPAFGSSEDNNSECKPPIMALDPGEPADALGGSPSAQTRQNSELDSDKITSSNRNSSSASGSGGGRAYGSNSNRRFATGQGSANGDASAGGGRRIEIALEGGGSGSYFQSEMGGGSGSIYRQRTRYVPISGDMASEALKKSEREASRTSTQQIEGDVGTQSRRKIAVQPPPPRNANLGDDNIKTLDITTIVKYILIAGIIIVLFALLGGQAAQLSKSWEKGE